MTRETVFFSAASFIVGVGIASAVAYSIIKAEVAPPPPCACENTNRYASTGEQSSRITIPLPGVGQTMSDNFVRTTGSTGKNRGVFISKKAFDQIFCNSGYNGVVFYFGQPDPGVKSYNLFFEGGNFTQTAIPNLQGGVKLYRADTYCPVCCGSIHD